MGYAPDDGVIRERTSTHNDTPPAFGWQPSEHELVARRISHTFQSGRGASDDIAPAGRSGPYWVPSRPGELPPTIIKRRKSATEQAEAGRRISHPVIVAMAVAAVGTGSFYNNAGTAGAVDATNGIDRSDYQRFATLGNHVVSDQVVANVSTGDQESTQASTAPSERGSFVQYTVQSGDELNKIAAAYGLRTSSLIWANNLTNPDLIYPGDVLNIPPTDGVAVQVQEGDTLSDIATRFGVSMTAIINYEPNGITNPDLIYTGQSLVIPGGLMPSSPSTDVATTQSTDSDTSVQVQAEPAPQPEPEPEPEPAPPPKPEGVDYEVQAGDTLTSIAERHGVQFSAIANYGPNGIANADALQLGQKLFIPGGTTPAPVEEAPAQLQQASQSQEAPAPTPPPAPDPTPTPAPEPEPEPQPSNDVGVANGNFIWPTEGVITQRFGHTSFSQSSGWYGSAGHTGLDIANRANTPIYAADGGTVIVSGWSGGFGYAVAIDHGNGYVTWYAHMAQQPPVGVGQSVAQGAFIGPMGSTGYSTGPHLHFEIRKNGNYQDPLQYLR